MNTRTYKRNGFTIVEVDGVEIVAIGKSKDWYEVGRNKWGIKAGSHKLNTVIDSAVAQYKERR